LLDETLCHGVAGRVRKTLGNATDTHPHGIQDCRSTVDSEA
jgi:hypothetical protein